ncbi:MAG: AraC family transcriptional regulator [Deltaproteobacteria bacterium]|nr:AraC family transcriptional regulator [Deltaproteobacteria bacterium]
MDTLSEVLRVVRLTGAVFFAVDASAPWVAEAPPACEIGPHIMPGVEHVIEYHVISSGSCWAGIVDEPPVKVTRGDVIVFPHGDRHTLSSAPGMRGVADPASFRGARAAGLPIAIHKDGGGADRASVICGFLGCDARPFNPLLAALPRMIHVPRAATEPNGAVEHLMKLALSESATRQPGGEAILARLSELLFVEVVRRHLAQLPPEQVGWLAGLRDDAVGRALGKLHQRPAHAWSLDELAREVGVARSVLAERFAHFVGIPPMQYLTRWRMQLAASLMTTTALGLAEIAADVGYGSERALSRAYKRWVGVAPAEWKRGQRGAVAGA